MGGKWVSSFAFLNGALLFRREESRSTTMKTTMRFKTCGIAVAAALLFCGCAIFKKPQPAPPAAYDINRPPVEAPELLHARMPSGSKRKE